jgi:hypothetical protein
MYKKIQYAKDLPPEWDKLCKDNIYMSKSFMEHMEKANYCNQSYHLFYKENKLYSGFMMFERKFNLFIFTDKYKINCPMKFIYLPLSVSHPSIVFDEDTRELNNVLNKMHGIKIIINVGEEELDGFAKGNYLPICTLENRWSSFDEYLSSMRSSYRRRINQALKKSENIEFEFLKNNNDFTDEMYGLYEQVFNHSQYSLEKLTADFFRNDMSKILLLKINGKVEAFIQIIEDKNNDMLIFEFCGYNYEIARDYDIYHNMLIKITQYAIDNGFKYIQFGQTAYDAKLKFGAQMHRNYFLLSHSNKVLNWLIKKRIHWLEYKVQEYDFSVFKENEQ